MLVKGQCWTLCPRHDASGKEFTVSEKECFALVYRLFIIKDTVYIAFIIKSSPVGFSTAICSSFTFDLTMRQRDRED